MKLGITSRLQIMIDYHKLNIVGALRIFPAFSFSETAEKLGVALGVHFTEDAPGTYDEFPSFSAEAAGLKFVLLGIPEFSEQIALINDFELQVGMSFYSRESAEACDASEYYRQLLRSKSDLPIG